MSNKDDSTDLLAVLALLGAIALGAAGFAALSKSDQRKRFEAAIREALAEQGVGLVSAELGGRRDGGHIWYVTVNHPLAGVTQYRARFDEGDAPYAPTTLQALLDRLFRAMPSTERALRRAV